MTKILMVGSFAVSLLMTGAVFSDGGYTTSSSSSASAPINPFAAMQAVAGGLSTCKTPDMKVKNLSVLQPLNGCSAEDSYTRVKSFFDQAISKSGGGMPKLPGGGLPTLKSGSSQ